MFYDRIENMTSEPIVYLTDSASLCGINACSHGSSDTVKSFLGIPYAQITERFSSPQALESMWTGLRNATQLGLRLLL